MVNKFTYVLVNEPVEKSDSKSEKIPDFVKDEDLYKTIQIKESEIGTTVKLLVNYPYPDRQKTRGIYTRECIRRNNSETQRTWKNKRRKFIAAFGNWQKW